MDVSTSSHAIVYIGIGSNLEQPLQQVERAVSALRGLPGSHLLSLSPWYGSTPVGGEADQPDYVNGVACLQTMLAPHDLLKALQAIEQDQGRERLTRWGARTLDLDLLLYDALTVSDEHLTLPHPRLHERVFVLRPLADITNGFMLPNGASVTSLLANLSESSVWRLPLFDTETTEDTPSTLREQSLNDG